MDEEYEPEMSAEEIVTAFEEFANALTYLLVELIWKIQEALVTFAEWFETNFPNQVEPELDSTDILLQSDKLWWQFWDWPIWDKVK